MSIRRRSKRSYQVRVAPFPSKSFPTREAADRAAMYPKSAANELEFLKRVLRDARARGQRVDDAIFGIEPVRHSPRRGRALTVEQLYEFASWLTPFAVRRSSPRA